METPAAAAVRSIKKGEHLVEEGQVSNTMYYVQAGAFSVRGLRTAAPSVEVGQIRSGELIGEMSFLDKEPRCATVTALMDSEVIEIPFEKFEATLNQLPSWVSALISTLSVRLRKTNMLVRT